MHPTIKLNILMLSKPEEREEKSTLEVGKVRALLDIDGTSVREKDVAKGKPQELRANFSLFKTLNESGITEVVFLSKTATDTTTQELGSVSARITRKCLLDDLTGEPKQSQILPKAVRKLDKPFAVKRFITHLDVGFRETKEYEQGKKGFFNHALLPVYEQQLQEAEAVAKSKPFQEARRLEKESRINEAVINFKKYMRENKSASGSFLINDLFQYIKIENTSKKKAVEELMNKFIKKYFEYDEAGKRQIKQTEISQARAAQKFEIGQKQKQDRQAITFKPGSKEYSQANDSISAKYKIIYDAFNDETDRLTDMAIMSEIWGEVEAHGMSFDEGQRRKIFEFIQVFIKYYSQFYTENIANKKPMAQLYFDPTYNSDIETTLGTFFADDEERVLSTVQKEFDSSQWRDEQTFTSLKVATKQKPDNQEAEHKEYQQKMEGFLNATLERQYFKVKLLLADVYANSEELYGKNSRDLKPIKENKDELERLLTDFNAKTKSGLSKLFAAKVLNLISQLIKNPTNTNCNEFEKLISAEFSTIEKSTVDFNKKNIKDIASAAKKFALSIEKLHVRINGFDHQYSLLEKIIQKQHSSHVKKILQKQGIEGLFDFSKLQHAILLQVKSLKKLVHTNPHLLSMVISIVDLTKQLLQAPTDINVDYYKNTLNQIAWKNPIISKSIGGLISRVSRAVEFVHSIDKSTLNFAISMPHAVSAVFSLVQAQQTAHAGFFLLSNQPVSPVHKKEKQSRVGLKRKMIVLISDIDKTHIIAKDVSAADRGTQFNTMIETAAKRNDIADRGFASAVLLMDGVEAEYKNVPFGEEKPIVKGEIPDHESEVGFRQLPTITQLDCGYLNKKSSLDEKSTSSSYWSDFGQQFYVRAQQLYKAKLQKIIDEKISDQGQLDKAYGNIISEIREELNNDPLFKRAFEFEAEIPALEYWLFLSEEPLDNGQSKIDAFFEEQNLPVPLRNHTKEAIKNALIGVLKNRVKNKEIYSQLAREQRDVQKEIDDLKKQKGENQIGQGDFQKQLKSLGAKKEDLRDKTYNSRLAALVNSELAGTLSTALSTPQKEAIYKFVTEIIRMDKQKGFYNKYVENKLNMMKLLFNGMYVQMVAADIKEEVDLEYIFVDDIRHNLEAFEQAQEGSLLYGLPSTAIHAETANDAATNVSKPERVEHYSQQFHNHMMKSMDFEAEQLSLLLNCIVEAAKATYPDEAQKQSLGIINSLKASVIARVDEFIGKNPDTETIKYNICPKFASELLNLTVKLLQNPTAENRTQYKTIITAKMLPQYKDRIFQTIQEKGKPSHRTVGEATEKIIADVLLLAKAADLMENHPEQMVGFITSSQEPKSKGMRHGQG